MLERRSSAVPGYDGALLRLATDLGNRLLPAFETRSGIPLSWIHLRKVRGTFVAALYAACSSAVSHPLCLLMHAHIASDWVFLTGCKLQG